MLPSLPALSSQKNPGNEVGAPIIFLNISRVSALCLPNLLLELADVCSRNIRLRQFPVLVFWCYLLLNWAYCYRRSRVLRTDFCGSQKFRKYCDCNRRFVPLLLLLKEGSWSYQVICFHKHMFNLY